MKSKEKSFLSKLIMTCLICFIVAIVSMLASMYYLINHSGIELDFVKPEAYKDYQG